MLLDIGQYAQKFDQIALSPQDAVVLLCIHLQRLVVGFRVDSNCVKKR